MFSFGFPKLFACPEGPRGTRQRVCDARRLVLNLCFPLVFPPRGESVRKEPIQGWLLGLETAPSSRGENAEGADSRVAPGVGSGAGPAGRVCGYTASPSPGPVPGHLLRLSRLRSYVSASACVRLAICCRVPPYPPPESDTARTGDTLPMQSNLATHGNLPIWQSGDNARTSQHTRPQSRQPSTAKP